MQPAPGEAPDEKAVNGAEGEVALAGRLARSGHVLEHPRELRGGKIGIQTQPGLQGHLLLLARLLQTPAMLGGPAVLPDDGVVKRNPSPATPQERRLALVRDADGGN